MINVEKVKAKVKAKEFYTIDESAAFLGMSKWAMYRYVRQKRFKSRKIGREIYIQGADILGWFHGEKKRRKKNK